MLSEDDDILSQDEIKCVNEVVKAVIILDYGKKPFKQGDILGFLSTKPSRKRWTAILNNAKEKLKEMGLVLVESKNNFVKVYYVISQLFPLPFMHRFASKNEVADRILLIIVLTFIFMREKSVLEVDILNHLEQLKIFTEENPTHEYFGDVKKKIFSDFVAQFYLEKIVAKEANLVQYKWGERACAEVTKRSILEFACKVGFNGKLEPKNLVSHYMEVLEEEKEKKNL